MDKYANQEIVILGGHGTFGSLIAQELVNSANVVIAGRDRERGQQFANAIGANYVPCDAKDKESLLKAVSKAFIVINASGPFRPGDYSIPQTCIEENCHYIDLADDREYVKGFVQLDELAKERGIFACTGASTTPTVTHALVSELSSQFPHFHSITIYLSAGNKNKPGISTFESILSYVGTPIRVWNHHQWENFMAWGSAEYVEFPPPVGRRLVQLCNVPDLELFPKLFEADKVIFKAGVELTIFNLGLSVLAQLKRYIPRINLPVLARPLVKTSRLLKNFGSFSGGVLVVLEDSHGNRKSLALVASQNGPRIPISPAVILSRKILRTGPPAHGAFPCVGFVSLDEFRDYLGPFGIQLIQ
jgi:saccharopine dehydrogenase-like protein